MFRPLLAAVFMTVSLAACQVDDADEPAPEVTGTTAEAEAAAVSVPMQSPVSPPIEATPQRQSAVGDDAGCGADKVGEWLNALPTEDVKADIAATVGDRPIRYYTQGDPITMDFSPARLNVELGKDGRIKLFRCG